MTRPRCKWRANIAEQCAYERKTWPLHSVPAITAFVNPFTSDAELAILHGGYCLDILQTHFGLKTRQSLIMMHKTKHADFRSKWQLRC
jgi:hypothetical protein